MKNKNNLNLNFNNTLYLVVKDMIEKEFLF